MTHPFRAAIEAGDLDATMALMHEDVVFRSPVVFTAYEGRAALRQILAAVMQVFSDFRYLREIGTADARDHALVFEAKVGDIQVQGCDFIQSDENGAITELMVMVRPMKAMLALADAMKAQLEAS